MLRAAPSRISGVWRDRLPSKSALASSASLWAMHRSDGSVMEILKLRLPLIEDTSPESSQGNNSLRRGDMEWKWPDLAREEISRRAEVYPAAADCTETETWPCSSPTSNTKSLIRVHFVQCECLHLASTVLSRNSMTPNPTLSHTAERQHSQLNSSTLLHPSAASSLLLHPPAACRSYSY